MPGYEGGVRRCAMPIVIERDPARKLGYRRSAVFQNALIQIETDWPARIVFFGLVSNSRINCSVAIRAGCKYRNAQLY